MAALLEIAAFDIESALIADQAGADRIELCAGAGVGGTTPSPETITGAKNRLRNPFFVMIRARGGDFVYSQEELGTMKADLLAAKSLGASGFVFGILKQDGTIDEAANKELITLAAPLPCTFHRAFDAITDKQEALETLIRCGFQRLLTSGGPGSAVHYADTLRQLVAQAGDRIIVMPGGGIRSHNLGLLLEQTGAAEFHSAAITSSGDFADAVEISKMKKIQEATT